MKILFINASQNRAGNTSQLAATLLPKEKYTQINLVDYKIYQIKQNFPDDQFQAVLQKLQWAEWIVLGTPVYWHEMSAYLKTLIERIGQDANLKTLAGKQISVFVQGTDPSDTIEPVTRIIKRFADVAQMKYVALPAQI